MDKALQQPEQFSEQDSEDTIDDDGEQLKASATSITLQQVYIVMSCCSNSNDIDCRGNGEQKKRREDVGGQEREEGSDSIFLATEERAGGHRCVIWGIA